MNFKKFQLVSTGFYLMTILIAFVVVLQTVSAEDSTSTNFKLRDPVTDIFGGRSTSTNFEQFNAGGQTVIGESASTNFKTQAGFLYFRPSGTATISAPASAALATKTVSTASQATTGTLDPVEVNSEKVGWSATITSTHITSIGPTIILSGTNSAVSFSGTYDGTLGILEPIGIYSVEITTAGAVGTAIFKWTDPLGVVTNNVTTAATVTLEKGVDVNFGAADYQVGEKWEVAVDVFLYGGLTVTPGAITVISGDTQVNAGSSEILTGAGSVSDPKSLMLANPDFGIGVYEQAENLDLTLKANSLNGNFEGTVTITIL